MNNNIHNIYMKIRLELTSAMYKYNALHTNYD